MMGKARVIEGSAAAARMQEIEKEEQAELNAKKNQNFVQLGRGSMHAFRNLIKRSGVAARVLLCFSENMSPSNSIAYGIDALQKDTGAGRSSIFDALNLLETEKWIQKVSDSGGVMYRVNSRAFWSSDARFKSASFKDELQVPPEGRSIKSEKKTKKQFLVKVVSK